MKQPTFTASLVPGHAIEILTPVEAETRKKKLRALGASYTLRKRGDGSVSLEYAAKWAKDAAHDYVGAARHRACAEICKEK